MLKRLLAALCACALAVAIAGCSAPAAEQETEQAEQTKTVTLYLPDEQGEAVVPTQTEVSFGGQDEAAALLAALVGEGVLPAEVAVGSLTQEEGNLTLDLNSAFAEALSASGSTGENMIMASVVDTYLAYYGAASLLITVDGGTLETGHAVYDEPFTQIFDAAPAA